MATKKTPKPAAATQPTRTAKAAKPVGAEKAPAASDGFPVVAIGASAGGLEAFEKFFASMSPASGMAFVVVQHLDPTHSSILTEILQRSTSMAVAEALDQVEVKPNHVYVIPPNREMDIAHGVLNLSLPKKPRGLHMPIDSFFRSLAEDKGEYSVGIVLSGTGSDGTLGLRAIHGAGGLCLVQDPATAKYDGMPVSAIQAGFATQVLAVEAMPKALEADARLRHLLELGRTRADVGKGLAQILTRLRNGTGHDFSQYKKSTLGRRIERRVVQHGLGDVPSYERYLSEHPDELQSLFRELLINVTSFFRDPQVFEYLKHEVLRPLVANAADGDTLRIWVAGCATGEEAYSLAMLLRELQDEERHSINVQIYSTDIDPEAITVGRAGAYTHNIAQDVSPQRLRRFFAKEDKGYRVVKEIREMVVFALQSVIKDPPFTRLDLLCCRNLLIYLEPSLQDRLMPTFHYALKPGGVLCLSPSESIGNHLDIFDPIERKFNIYRAKPSLASRRTLLNSRVSWTPAGAAPGAVPDFTKPREIAVAELARRALLQSFAPASVLTDMSGNILYVHGETGKYLSLAPGQPSNNIIDMARDALQLELREALRHAQGAGMPSVRRELSIKSASGVQLLHLGVHTLPGQEPGQKLLLISFQEMEQPAVRKGSRKASANPSIDTKRIDDLERELRLSKQSMGAMVEEQQASNEELQSTNEELQSTNEELQSTNEELETSKEELQSVNEELITVNSELQNKVELLTSMQDDMKNLLDNISVGTIFLDRHLMIRRFTRDATRIYRLVSSDVGRPLADIRGDLVEVDLLSDAQKVLSTLTPIEREVQTTGGTWYLARVQPYRTVDNMIDGVVMTFSDVSERIKAVAARRASDMAEAIIDAVHEPLIVLDGQRQVVSANQAYFAQFGGSATDTLHHNFYACGKGLWDFKAMHALLDEYPSGQLKLDARELAHEFAGKGMLNLKLTVRRLEETAGTPQLTLLSIEVLTPA
jgi:two-component system, chemotaxis family, CheB/CheR fusion protein